MKQLLARTTQRKTTHSTSSNQRLLPVAFAVWLYAVSANICTGLFMPTQALAQGNTPQGLQGKATDPLACNLAESQKKFANTSKLEEVFDDLLLPHLQAQLPACQNNVAWLVWAGQTLMKAKQHLLAADYLERALMIDPDNKGAKLDYAIALAGSEQPEAAALLAQSLLKEKDIPEHLALSINGLLSRLTASQNNKNNFAGLLSFSTKENQGNYFNASQPLGNTSQHRFLASIKTGRDSNLLGAPNLSEMNIYFSGTPFSLPLDSSYLSQPGNYSRADVGWSTSQPLGGGAQWTAWAQARSRESAATVDARQQQAVAGGEYRTGLLSSVLGTTQALEFSAYASSQAAQVRSGSSLKYNAQTIGAGLLRANQVFGAKCESKAGAERQSRDMQSNAVLSGNYKGLSAQWFCQQPAGQAWLVVFTKGHDTNTDPARAGGKQSESTARVMAKVANVQAELEADYKKDSSIYSVLLGENVRKIARVGARLEWQASVSNYQLQAGLQWSYQKSNLQLFRQQNWGPYIGASRAW
jgi:hypothetical protein